MVGVVLLDQPAEPVYSNTAAVVAPSGSGANGWAIGVARGNMNVQAWHCCSTALVLDAGCMSSSLSMGIGRQAQRAERPLVAASDGFGRAWIRQIATGDARQR